MNVAEWPENKGNNIDLDNWTTRCHFCQLSDWQSCNEDNLWIWKGLKIVVNYAMPECFSGAILFESLLLKVMVSSL